MIAVVADADVVFAGGPVFTADAVRRRVTGVAVRAGRIVAVGHDEVRELAGPRTQVVDLTGRLLVPGFQDAHVHPVQGGLLRQRCDLDGLRGPAAYADRVRAYATRHPDRPWITGGGWAMPDFPGGTPRREDLDDVVADRPVLLMNRDGHGGWANTRALELAGVDATTDDPPDGRIEREADGTPTGTLHEGAVRLVSRLVPEDTIAEHVAALLDAQAHLHALGVTAWQDAIVGDFAGFPDGGPAYADVVAQGRLSARVVGALWWDRGRGLEQVDDLAARREALTAGGFRATSVKIMQDGVAENGTAAMLQPYLDGQGGTTTGTGRSFVPPDVLAAAVTRLDALGFQVHVHAIGDRAVREALDAVATARATNGWTDNRHHIAHLQVVHPDDVPRFRELGVTATMQPLWAAYDAQMRDLTLPFLGEPRASWQYPFGALQRAGAVLAAGSDWPVSSPDPLAGIHVAVNRRPPAPELDGASDVPFLPWQALDLASALTAYTAGSAYVNSLDDTGTIAVGNLADLVVLDRDPFAGPPQDVWTTTVLRTYVGGELVHDRLD